MNNQGKKKLLITGLSGKIGYVLGPLLKKHYAVSGIVYHHSIADPDIRTFDGSLTDTTFLQRVIDQVQPDFLLHLGATSSIPFCSDNPALAYQVNVEATAVLARLCSKHGVRMLFTSTDMVYDGKCGNYSENDLPSPLSVYGKTKMEAEEQVLEKNFPVFRLALNYGVCPTYTPNFFYHVYRKLLNTEPVELFEDEIRSMLYTPDLAPPVIKGFEHQITGLYHVGGPEAVSRFAFGQELCRQMGVADKLLIPTRIKGDERFADRPLDLSLNSSKFAATFPEIKFRTHVEGIADFLRPTNRN